MVVITAGSSASERDMTAEVIKQLGEPGVLVHGVNVRPGKPTILAVCAGKPVIGLPGNPVSALVIAGLFVQPAIARLLGDRTVDRKPVIKAIFSAAYQSAAGRDAWVPLVIKTDGRTVRADPVFFKSNLIFNLARADGLMHIPADCTGVSAGETVDVELL
jgi:molybdopterin molybdotransferase